MQFFIHKNCFKLFLSAHFLINSQLHSDVCCLRWNVKSVVTIKRLQYIKIATPCPIKNNVSSNLIWTSLKRTLFTLHLLVHIVCLRRTYWKKKSWQIHSKSSGKSILRRQTKIALTVNRVSSFFKHSYFLNCVPKITYLCSKLCNNETHTCKYTIMNLLYRRNRSAVV